MILVGIFLVMLSYREVVSVYTKGEVPTLWPWTNFGPARPKLHAPVTLPFPSVVTLAVLLSGRGQLGDCVGVHRSAHRPCEPRRRIPAPPSGGPADDGRLAMINPAYDLVATEL